MITPRSVDLVFTFPAGRGEEIESALMARGFSQYFIEEVPGNDAAVWQAEPAPHQSELRSQGVPPTLHLVFHEGDGAPPEEELSAFLAAYGCTPVNRIEKDAIDWIRTWIDSLEPFELAGGIWVNPYPDRDLEPPRPSLRVVPGFAFGTGHHATTRLAAGFTARYLRPGNSVLDVGCGTAILALLALRLGAGETWACDNDPMAVSRARETLDENKGTSIHLFQSDLLASVPEGKRFDLVIANIVTEVLRRLFIGKRLEEILAPGGTLILSGIHPEGKPLMEGLLRAGNWRVDAWAEESHWWACACRRA